MAAKIGTVRTAPREVRGATTGEPYIVQFTPPGLLIREKGRQGGPSALDYDAIYSLAVKADLGGEIVSAIRPRKPRK